jgi:hypothetical protein
MNLAMPPHLRHVASSRVSGAQVASFAFEVAMKAYLITTGSLFALLALLHLVLTITHFSRLVSDPWFMIQGPAIGLIAGALSLWAWRLLRGLPTSKEG